MNTYSVKEGANTPKKKKGKKKHDLEKEDDLELLPFCDIS